MQQSERISLDPAVRSGKPVIRGTRITVTDLLEYLAGGMSHEEILSDFPDLVEEDIQAALAFAAERERRPPKVIWLRMGNASTREIADVLRDRSIVVPRFIEDSEGTFLPL